jgi:hypothetical protein
VSRNSGGNHDRRRRTVIRGVARGCHVRDQKEQVGGEMSNSKVVIKQQPDEPVAAEVIARAIIGISDSMKKLSTSGLKRKAIVALIHDHSGIRKGDIEIVLNNLEALRETWCTR